MRKVAVVAVACVLSLSLAAQMKVPTKPPVSGGSKKAPLQPRPSVQTNFSRISIADAKKLYQSGEAVFVDVRSNEQFTYGHIKGAFSIPGSQLIRRWAEVPPRKTYIMYCACDAEQSSGRAAANLMAHGVKNVYALKGGWDEWKSAGLPTAVGPK